MPAIGFSLLNKAVNIFLLFIVLLQSGGLLLVYNLRQCYVQYEMKGQLSNKQVPLQTLKLSLTDFQKSKFGDDEIRFGGKMYDIKSFTFKNDIVELIVVNDTKEEAILAKMEALADDDEEESKGTTKQLIKLLISNYIISETHGLYLNTPRENDFITPPSFFHSFRREIPYPPPKLVLPLCAI